MTEAEIEAEKLVKLIHEARDAARDAKDHGEKRFGQIDQAIADLDAAQKRIAQAQDAANRQAFESSVNGSNRELGYYAPSQRDVESAPGAYAKAATGSQAIRLVGHQRVPDPSRPQRSFQVWGLFDDPAPKSQWQLQAQRLLDRRNFVQACLRASGKNTTERAYRAEAELLDHMRSGPDEVRRIFADSSGIGDSWIPDNPMPELERELLHRPSMWQIFPQVQMTRNPLVKPNISGNVTAYKGSIPTSDDPAADPTLSGFTPGSHVITAEEVAAGAQFHLNAEEDAIISFEQEIRNQLIEAQLFAIENAIINGDASATHQDTIASWNVRGRVGTPRGLSNSQLRLWTGLRARSGDLTSMRTDASGAAISEAHLLADRALLNPISLLNSDGKVQVVEIVSPETFFGSLISLDEFDAFDNVGLLASVITGQLGDTGRTPGGVMPGQVGFTHGRFPLIVSYCLTKDLATTGLYTGTGATTSKLTVDISRFRMYLLRGQMVKMVEDIRNNTGTVISRARMKFEAQDAASASIKDVHERYNTI